MKLAMIGLGKMGMNLVANMLEHEVTVVVYDRDAEAVNQAEKLGAIGASSLGEVVAELPERKIIWSMLPAGEVTNLVIKEVAEMLHPQDIIIDGGNSFYEDSVSLGTYLAEKNIHFFDVGTSGGMNGARNGGNFMIGGDEEIFKEIEPLFQKIAEKDGYLYTGPQGSGHYLKMVHNGIEYGMMQAIGEGFELLEHSPYEYQYPAVAKVWNNGSVIRSWLMELIQAAFEQDTHLDKVKGTMYSSGEGRWTVEEALKRQVAIPVITTSLMMRYRSLEDDTFTGKVVSSLRNGFGGHSVDSNE